MIYRVHYPLITQDGHRDFATREEAEKFANERRTESRYQSIHAWRHVRIEEVAERDEGQTPRSRGALPGVWER